MEWSIDVLNRLNNLPSSAFEDLAYKEERKLIGRINEESCERKKLRYWKNTIIEDEPHDWEWNFIMLRKKLEYNIGYFRLTQRYLGWETDVERMELSCRLMVIARGEESIYDDNIYVNTRNCERFKMKTADFDDDAEFLDVYKNDLRKAKAYQLVWTIFRQNMKRWWD